MVTIEALQWASRHSLQLAQRAKTKTAWAAEGHNEILRQTCHKCQTQLAAEGLDAKFSHVLADAVFSKNALLSIGEGAPYVALLGRAPALLSQIEQIAGVAHLSDETGVDGSRHIHRLRETLVSSMFEALAERRFSLIKRSGPAPVPGTLLALQPGDQVEVYRTG